MKKSIVLLARARQLEAMASGGRDLPSLDSADLGVTGPGAPHGFVT
jgi:hypothetical protein